MKKYMNFKWTIDGSGWGVHNTLEDAKNDWCFGMMVFEINAEDEEKIYEYGREVKNNRLILEKLSKSYPLVFQDGEPPLMFVSK